MSRRRVFLRGAGARTPLGASWPETCRALAAGKSAIAPHALFLGAELPAPAAAIVPSLPAGNDDRRVPLARAAAREAWDAAALCAPPERIAVFVGAESGRADWETVLGLARDFDPRRFGESARRHAGRIAAAAVSPAAVASALAREVGARGPAQTLSIACASGSAAIAEATRALRLGACDVALCGGVGADVDLLCAAAFELLGALSRRGICRPFDRRRDGFVLGEGAAMVVLSVEQGDAAVEVAGLGRTLDARSLTAPDPDGEGAAAAMASALRDAGLPGVAYVQAHATGTPVGDAAEALAIRRVLGDMLAHARVSSVKGALGHAIAGAGALGFLCAAEAVAHGTVLPTAGLEEPAPDCALPHVLGEALQRDVPAALVNSFGFGGANVSLALRRAA